MNVNAQRPYLRLIHNVHRLHTNTKNMYCLYDTKSELSYISVLKTKVTKVNNINNIESNNLRKNIYRKCWFAGNLVWKMAMPCSSAHQQASPCRIYRIYHDS